MSDSEELPLVTWKCPEDPERPKNWTRGEKWRNVGIVSTYTLMSSAASSIIAPAEPYIARDLGITSSFELSIVFSVFLLGYVVGPLVMAPLSELYGRAIVLRTSSIFFALFCLASGFATTSGQLIAFRLLAGIGACAPQTVGGGILSDCFRADERGKALMIYSLAPVLGPSIAPLAGGFIATNIGWQWCFWILTIFSAFVSAGLWLLLRETYPPVILARKAQRLRKESGDESIVSELELTRKNPGAAIRSSLVRPVILLFTQPIVQFMALFQSLIYGVVFLMLSTFPRVWTSQYGESVQIGGLNYIAIAIGMLGGAQGGGFTLDRVYKWLKESNNKTEGVPEYRIPLMVPCSILIAIGLVLYGWTAEYHVHWIVPDIGAAIFAFGAFAVFAIPQSYIIDAYPRYAASAIGVTAIARSLAGFGFPLFADVMFDRVGYGWGNTILAFSALFIGLGGSAILWFYGEKLRKHSQYASG